MGGSELPQLQNRSRVFCYVGRLTIPVDDLKVCKDFGVAEQRSNVEEEPDAPP